MTIKYNDQSSNSIVYESFRKPSISLDINGHIIAHRPNPRRSFRRNQGFCPVRIIGDSQSRNCYFLRPLTGINVGVEEKVAPFRSPSNSLNYSGGQQAHAFHVVWVIPWNGLSSKVIIEGFPMEISEPKQPLKIRHLNWSNAHSESGIPQYKSASRINAVIW